MVNSQEKVSTGFSLLLESHFGLFWIHFGVNSFFENLMFSDEVLQRYSGYTLTVTRIKNDPVLSFGTILGTILGKFPFSLRIAQYFFMKFCIGILVLLWQSKNAFGAHFGCFFILGVTQHFLMKFFTEILGITPMVSKRKKMFDFAVLGTSLGAFVHFRVSFSIIIKTSNIFI